MNMVLQDLLNERCKAVGSYRPDCSLANYEIRNVESAIGEEFERQFERLVWGLTSGDEQERRTIYEVACELYHLTMGGPCLKKWLLHLPSVWGSVAQDEESNADPLFDMLDWNDFSKALMDRQAMVLEDYVGGLVAEFDRHGITDSARADADSAAVVVPDRIPVVGPLPYMMRFQWMVNFGQFCKTLGRTPDKWSPEDFEQVLDGADVDSGIFAYVCQRPGLWKDHFEEYEITNPGLPEWRAEHPTDHLDYWSAAEDRWQS